MIIKQKYFTADTLEDAKEKAYLFFDSNQAGVITEIKREGNETAPWLILAINTGSRGERALENISAGYMLSYEDDGVYLEIYPSRGTGTPLDKEALSNYVMRKGLKQLNASEVLGLIGRASGGRCKIAPEQEEILLNEDILVSVSRDEQEGFIKFLAPDTGGTLISQEDAALKIASAGILYGIDPALLDQAFKDHNYNKRYLIAKALPPQDGVNGKLEFHFDIGSRSTKPRELAKGKIDYKTLDLFVPVIEGALLVTRHLATPGVPGRSVKDRELKPKPGREVNLPKYKNVIVNDDKTAMYAKMSGMVDFAGNSVNVTNVYNIKGDCDLSVGNIDFDGSIIIAGNVMQNLVVKASGNITVGGVVEGSDIIAGGNVELKRGIQGMDKGRVIAEGTINAQFIERATVIAGDDIIAGTIVHSSVEAGKSLVLAGNRASIMGGSIRAASEVIAKVIGSAMHTQTDIEVGLMPKKRTRMEHLRANIKKQTDELDKIEKLETYLSRSSGNMPDEEKARIFKSAQANKLQIRRLLDEFSEELNELEFEAANATEGRVHVTDTVFPRVRISIASANYKVSEPINYATFRYEDGDIGFIPCEIDR